MGTEDANPPPTDARSNDAHAPQQPGVLPPRPSKLLENIDLTWPDDCVLMGPDDKFETFVKQDLLQGNYPWSIPDLGQSLDQEKHDGRMRRLFFRPQVTVNVYSTGGTAVSGSTAAGGTGAGAGTGAGSGAGVAAAGALTKSQGIAQGVGDSAGGSGGLGGQGDGGDAEAQGGRAQGGNAVFGGNGTGVGIGASGDLAVAASSKGPMGDTFSLAAKFEALSRKVEELSKLVSSAAARTSVIESGMQDMDVRPWLPTEARINFSKQFRSAPSVMVTISSVDIHNGSNFRVKVYATEVSPEGFTAHADSWGQTLLCSCGISWMAFGE